MEHKINFSKSFEIRDKNSIICFYIPVDTEHENYQICESCIAVPIDKYKITKTGKQKMQNDGIISWVFLECDNEKFAVYNYQFLKTKDTKSNENRSETTGWSIDNSIEKKVFESARWIIDHSNPDHLPSILCGEFHFDDEQLMNSNHRSVKFLDKLNDNVLISKFCIKGDKLVIKTNFEYFIKIETDYRCGPSLTIREEGKLHPVEDDSYDMAIDLRETYKREVRVYDFENGEIFSIAYETKEQGQKMMKQIFAKHYDRLPFVVTECNWKEKGYYPETGDIMKDAPKEILDFEIPDDYCFCLMVNGGKIEDYLIINPLC